MPICQMVARKVIGYPSAATELEMCSEAHSDDLHGEPSEVA